MTDPLAPHNAGMPPFQPQGGPFPPQDTPFEPQEPPVPAQETPAVTQAIFPPPQDAAFQPQDTFYRPPDAFDQAPDAFPPDAFPPPHDTAFQQHDTSPLPQGTFFPPPFPPPQDTFVQPPPPDTFYQPDDFLPRPDMPMPPAGAPLPPAGGRGPGEPWAPRTAPAPRRPRWRTPGAAVLAGLLVAGGIVYALAAGSPGKSVAGGPATGGAGPTTGTGPGGSGGQGATRRPGAAPTAAASPGTGGQSPAPPVTLTAAKAILARYTAVNNTANTRESVALLGTYEARSSLALDSAIYRAKKAGNSRPYPAYAPERATFYIPREEAAYPHWFAVRASDVTLGTAHRLLGLEYLVFLQAAPGAPWKDAIEPYLVKGGAAPRVALGPDGYATAVGPGARGLEISPARIASVTASSLDGTGPVRDPGDLADLHSAALLRSKLSATVAITDRHMPDAGGFFGLRTADGGALLFYADAATVTITPPHGQTVGLTIPGIDYGTRRMAKAGLTYLEQFAAYDPPGGGMTQGAANPRVIADFSGITGH